VIYLKEVDGNRKFPILIGIFEAERKRLEKQRDDLAKFIDSIDKKLANKAFVDKAPADVVRQQRDKLAEVGQQLASVEAALAKLIDK
jgi:valyl-tRNA synthetase